MELGALGIWVTKEAYLSCKGGLKSTKCHEDETALWVLPGLQILKPSPLLNKTRHRKYIKNVQIPTASMI